MTLGELLKATAEALAEGRIKSDSEVGITHATSGNPRHKDSAVFPLLCLDFTHGRMNLVSSNHVDRFIPKVFQERISPEA